MKKFTLILISLAVLTVNATVRPDAVPPAPPDEASTPIKTQTDAPIKGCPSNARRDAVNRVSTSI